MVFTKIRQQGGAMVVTIPRDMALQMGWQVGTRIALENDGDSLSLKPAKRTPRGRLTLAELLGQIDSEEIATLNQSISDQDDYPVGKEV
ncbi:AbrB/MazE/SpoVT family DNA-binding domain-containing protein [Nissabacter sp. SGAir0207]|uniref:AbrB/MazE/SpoVT family DNA-binding domain-containing protein n=1 Tax=Nissabacter sp. SGAir0207 TaxID=2126321 RepID=UPI0010CCDB88|nr:AbrB/MazE/SpoVT family DNA-binding domain-containing protein [Nissabacter sp. SGAir0207]QCR36681.1 antitoxin [Nissabacter sp. SGAir0207]